jgi:hypothetical protein
LLRRGGASPICMIPRSYVGTPENTPFHVLGRRVPREQAQPCFRRSPRVPASRGPAARHDAPGSTRASPGDRSTPRGSSSAGTTAWARNGHPPNPSCKPGSSSGRRIPWPPLVPGSSLVPFLPVHGSERQLLLPPFSLSEEAKTLRLRRVHGATTVTSAWDGVHPPNGLLLDIAACIELPRTPSKRSSQKFR